MNAGHSLQRKCGYRNVLESDMGKICWSPEMIANASSISRIGSINIKLAYWQTKPPNVYMLAMLIKKQQHL